MKILILEDEAAVARELSFLLKDVLKDPQVSIDICKDLDEARVFIQKNKIDVLFLDLNLNGEDGFDLLKYSASKDIPVVVTSAYKNRAIEAFDHKVLDFIPKPFEKSRLVKALERIKNVATYHAAVNHIGIRKGSKMEMVEMGKVIYIKGSGAYSEIFMTNKSVEVHSKSLNKLSGLLPNHFERVHKSYIVNMNMVAGLVTKEGSRYELVLKDNITVPVSRSLIMKIRGRFI